MNATLARLNHPRPQLQADGGLRGAAEHSRRPGLCGSLERGPDFFLAVASSPAEATAKAKVLTSDCGPGLRRFVLRAHYALGHVLGRPYLPNPIEFLWYYGQYLLVVRAAPSRRAAGLWPMDGVMPPWRRLLRQHECAGDVLAGLRGGHRVAGSWCDLINSRSPKPEFTRRFFGTEGTFWICPAAIHDRARLAGAIRLEQFRLARFARLDAMALSMDRQWLAETGYPVVAEIFKFYRANLRKEADGFLRSRFQQPGISGKQARKRGEGPGYRHRRPSHVRLGRGNGAGAGRTSCHSARTFAAPAGSVSPDRQEELCLCEQPLDESHRHPSHLMAIHPAMDLTIEDDAATQTINASLEQFFSLGRYR